jgi:chromosome segregation protein
MQINKLRLLGFKSFVEPTELVIGAGLTGVVGPNGCGKSNLLEALRWVMGETSYKTMRGSSMDDVIFSGTNTRPGRNMAEVTIFLDNSARRAPPEFNDSDTLEVTRRIERDAGSAYRINGREARARDVKILFEDNATGARSPALVRQGQISEIVNAKPEARRRILEDAAGVAGLHSRRHDAELRLKAADANLARVSDVLGQLTSQIESLKRQARQARRYKELSGEIRRTEALVFHLSWLEAQDQVNAEEAALADALRRLGIATQADSELTRLQSATADQLQPLREAEAVKGAVLHRLKVEQENFEREVKRSVERQKELENRVQQLKRDAERELALASEARDSLKRFTLEKAEHEATSKLARAYEAEGLKAHDEAEAAVKNIETRLVQLQTAAAEARARRRSLETQKTERTDTIGKLQRQLTALEAQARDIAQRAPDTVKLQVLTQQGQTLATAMTDVEARMHAAEANARLTVTAAQTERDAAASAVLQASRLKTEVETLIKLLGPAPGDDTFAPIVDQLRVAPGYETALGAALGDDLEASDNDSAPIHWLLNPAHVTDPALPEGALPLITHVQAPAAMTRSLAQIGLVQRDDGARLQKLLKSGQRLVSKQGDLWRWDGLVAMAHGATAAALRLEQRNRLSGLKDQEAQAAQIADVRAEAAKSTAAAHAAAEAEERRLRQLWRETQSTLSETRETLTRMEQQARETEQRLSSVNEQREIIQENLIDANERLDEVELSLETLGESNPFEEQLAAAQEDAAERRTAVADARAQLATLEREHRARTERIGALVAELVRWQTRSEGADAQAQAISERIQATAEELEAFADLPEQIEEQRQKLLDSLVDAERQRKAAADQLAASDTAHRKAAQDLKAAQETVSVERENRARIEARLEAARTRRGDEARKIRDALDCAPDACLGLAELTAGVAIPALVEVDRTLTRLKTDRDRLGGVNLAADDELNKMQEQFDSLDKERLDVEEAIAKLRGGIGQLNKEAKARLATAFDAVNGHFQRLFGVLFGGGEARLELIESDEDPLAGGLEIIAKPPGKKPATLSLLSGGEQTLTALSLIFAVFLTNPSPICVLDEVDAPLDDSNTDRFCLMMESMAADTATRFLVITHHPMTMARMNRLFGVTMGEKGVSQLVSVDLETAKRVITEEAA